MKIPIILIVHLTVNIVSALSILLFEVVVFFSLCRQKRKLFKFRLLSNINNIINNIHAYIYILIIIIIVLDIYIFQYFLRLVYTIKLISSKLLILF